MASYHKNVRIAYENRKNIGNTGTVLQFLWHIMITGIFYYSYVVRTLNGPQNKKIIVYIFQGCPE